MTGARRSVPIHGTLLLLPLAGLGCAPAPGADSLLLITLDTTRPDALSCYGPAQPGTPVLDQLAREGVLFERAYSSAPITLPAHAALFTGLQPPRSGLRDNGREPLPASATTLAELARDAGYRTAAFVGAVVLDPAFGLDQGFELYDAPRAQARDGAEEREAERPAREVVDGALAWLQARERERPFFLWLHLYDMHAPYEPSAELSGQSLRARYQGEMAGVDRELGRLFGELRAQGELERTLVVVAGDHGEAFGEHGEEGHSVHCYETTLRIPLIVRAPGWARFAPGARTDELVGLVDLVPTLCAALGWEPPAGSDGSGLDGRSFWDAPRPADQGLYFESYYGYLNFGWSPLSGWIDGRGKYLHSSTPRYFDPRTDPLEERDLLSERAQDVRSAQRAIAELVARPALAAGAAQRPAEELLQALRGLGYAAAGEDASALPHPLEETGLPSPESMGASYELALEALRHGQRGELAEAEEKLRTVLEDNPRNPFVLDQLGVCLLQAGRHQEAEEILSRLLELEQGGQPGTWFKLAACAEALGRPEEAIERLQRALELDPARGKYLAELVRLLRANGRAGEAAELEERLRAPGDRR